MKRKFNFFFAQQSFSLFFLFALLNLCRCDVFKEEKFLYLGIFFLCYSIIIFLLFQHKKTVFIFFPLAFSRQKLLFFLRRLTKRKNELNLIANRDATTQLLCQYAKNTQTFNSTVGLLEIFVFALFAGEKRTFVTLGLNYYFHFRGKLCPKIYSVRFSIILLAGAVNSALLKIPHSKRCRNADEFKSRFLLLTFSRTCS